MKRDMNLLRRLLLRVEDAGPGEVLKASQLTFDGFTVDQVKYHALLAYEGGLVHGKVLRYLSGPGIDDMFIDRLTVSGHNFVDHARSDTVWKRAMDQVSKMGGAVSVEVMTAVLVKATKLFLDV